MIETCVCLFDELKELTPLVCWKSKQKTEVLVLIKDSIIAVSLYIAHYSYTVVKTLYLATTFKLLYCKNSFRSECVTANIMRMNYKKL